MKMFEIMISVPGLKDGYLSLRVTAETVVVDVGNKLLHVDGVKVELQPGASVAAVIDVEMLVKLSQKDARDGEPCDHAGCLSHVRHPCEGCGRIQGRGVYVAKPVFGDAIKHG